MELPKTGDLFLGKYLLEKAIGEGGMGVVYAARHELLGQRVAVKLIRPEYAMHGEAVARFLNEARAAARIENEHVARVLDVGVLDGALPYMVLEYLDGADLETVLGQRGPLPVAEVADFLLQAIEAVAHAHALGIVHRDLKPSNLFLARRPDGTSRVKVLDFGISKVLGAVAGPSANITRTNTMLGSPLYMSPEQLRDSKSVDRRCDIWALGVVAYELLTGRPPFNADNAVALFAAIQESEAPSVRASRPDVDRDLDAIIVKCLRRHPEERFSSVTELAFSLVPFGTAVAAGAFDNAKRILPLAESSAVQRAANPPFDSKTRPLGPRIEAQGEQIGGAVVSAAPLEGTVAAPQSLDSAHGVAVANSTAGLRSSSHSDAPPRRGSAVVVALGLVGLFAAAVVVAGMIIIPRFSPTPTPASTSTLASASTSTPSSTPSSTPTPTPTSTATAILVSASTKPRPMPPPSTLAGTTTPIPSKATVPTVPPAASSNCNPPYELDRSGKKIWKRECL